MTLAENLIEQTASLALLQEGERSPLHTALCTALMSGAEELAVLAADPYPMAVLLDPFRCPVWALGFCAIVYGTTVPEGMPEPLVREYIDATHGWRRGRDESLLAAVKLTLNGSRYAFLQRRHNPATGATDAPGHITVTVRASECPDPTATAAMAEAAKLYGLVLHLVVTTGQTWGEARSVDSRTWDELGDDEPTTTWAAAHGIEV